MFYERAKIKQIHILLTKVCRLLDRSNGQCFTDDDEMAFRLFAVYCAMALHYSKIFNEVSHQRTKFKVAMEVLEFHLCSSLEDADLLYEEHAITDEQIPEGFYSLDFCCYDYDSLLPRLFIRIVQETFGDKQFEIHKLCRFALTVRKNYRPVTYHNWQHGFHVTHALWAMIRGNQSKLSRLEKMSLLIGGISHDIDHRGYNNDFFKKMNLPLAALYSTSTMEQHHYRQTITVLHSDGHDIFSFLSAEEHKTILDLIRYLLCFYKHDVKIFFPIYM